MTVQIVILAGGKSRRMGKDKALLSVDNKPLLQRTIQVTTSLGAKAWIVTPWRDAYAQFFSNDAHWLDDPLQQGPLVALTIALPQIPPAEWILVLACDLPYLNVIQLTHWLELLKEVPDEYVAALVKQDDYWEPLCGFYRPSIQNSLKKFVAQEGKSFQKWLTHEKVFTLPVIDPQMLFNCNTPTDFVTLRRHTP